MVKRYVRDVPQQPDKPKDPSFPRFSRDRYEMAGKSTLHRKVWVAAMGSVPKGWVIHHINLHRTDNRIENLIALPKRCHGDLHGRINMGFGAFIGNKQACQAFLEQWLSRTKKDRARAHYICKKTRGR